MTLDETIKHAEEVAIDQDLCCSECAEEHRHGTHRKSNGGEKQSASEKFIFICHIRPQKEKNPP